MHHRKKCTNLEKRHLVLALSAFYFLFWKQTEKIGLQCISTDPSIILETKVLARQTDLLTFPSEEFELTANSLGALVKVTESSAGMGHGSLHFEDIYLAHDVLTR